MTYLALSCCLLFFMNEYKSPVACSVCSLFHAFLYSINGVYGANLLNLMEVLNDSFIALKNMTLMVLKLTLFLLMFPVCFTILLLKNGYSVLSSVCMSMSKSIKVPIYEQPLRKWLGQTEFIFVLKIMNSISRVSRVSLEAFVYEQTNLLYFELGTHQPTTHEAFKPYVYIAKQSTLLRA